MTPDWASSFGAAVNAYPGGGGLSEGMVTGIVMQAWQGGKMPVRALILAIIWHLIVLAKAALYPMY